MSIQRGALWVAVLVFAVGCTTTTRRSRGGNFPVDVGRPPEGPRDDHADRDRERDRDRAEQQRMLDDMERDRDRELQRQQDLQEQNWQDRNNNSDCPACR